MKYIVSLSWGSGSTVAAQRAFDRYGKENVLLWFADTLFEDEDLYRFQRDVLAHWGMEQTTYTDGRTPLQVFEQAKLIGNNRMAPCSFTLKVKPFRKFIQEQLQYGPVTVLLGMDWKEQHRMESPRKAYEALGAQVDYPLMWKPYELTPYQDVIRSWGIEPPRLYSRGFPHNYCGGRCVKQGIHEWLRLLIHFPDRFEEMRLWEEAQRAKGGARSTRSMCSETINGKKQPLPLTELKSRFQAGYYKESETTLFDTSEYKDDRASCFCTFA